MVSPYPLSKTVLQTRIIDRVAIVGAGLAAVDVVLALKSSGHQGPITMVPRGGLLPPVRPPRLDDQLRHFTVGAVERLAGLKQREPRRQGGPTREHLQLKDMIDLMWREFGEAGASRDALLHELFPQRYGLERLRDQLKSVDDGEIALPLAFKILATTFEEVW
ncbi:hypothetical protein [Arthrobacter sp. ISL-28]|uniref:hypothetical protein n=1 Tax=Arthrobacter sp. ISL-28 TaxID=2819108 RepID=UPI001BE9A840|nr:hypothetical protein [Arthrobacter sp. ISL-28]MBT2522009.1 hypothetical protein [Arthrobacter sp. ISL-28]